MYVANVMECFFFVYTQKHSIMLVVEKDDDFLSEVIPQLEHFYFNVYVKELAHNMQTWLNQVLT